MLGACVAGLAVLCVARAALAGEALRTVHIHASHKELSSVLAAIDEKLKVLDTITAVQAKQSRRLDVIQDKLDRVETTISIKLERAQLAVDRLEHRLHMLQTNVQTTIKESTDRLERSQSKVAEVALNLTTHLDTHRHLLEKVSGAYAETWRRSLTLEGMMRDGFPLINVTRRELADGFRALARRQRDSRMTSGDLEATFTRRLNDNTYRLDLKMQEVLDAQKSFLSSCKSQVQQDDPRQFADVLDKLFDSLIDKTASTFRELQTIQATMKTHDNRVMKLLNTGRNNQNDATCRRLEAAFRNTSHSTFKETELNQLTEKFVALTNRADAALQRLEKQLGDEGPGPASDVTAAADQLMYKLKGIKGEQEDDENDDWGEDDQDSYFDELDYKHASVGLKAKSSSYFAEDEDTRILAGSTGVKKKTDYSDEEKRLLDKAKSSTHLLEDEEKRNQVGARTKKPQPSAYFDDGGGDMMDEDKDILTGLEPKRSTLTTRAPHRRHLHKHPYDRGPG